MNRDDFPSWEDTEAGCVFWNHWIRWNTRPGFAREGVDYCLVRR